MDCAMLSIRGSGVKTEMMIIIPSSHHLFLLPTLGALKA
jgi:hypothetical protein